MSKFKKKQAIISYQGGTLFLGNFTINFDHVKIFHLPNGVIFQYSTEV